MPCVLFRISYYLQSNINCNQILAALQALNHQGVLQIYVNIFAGASTPPLPSFSECQLFRLLQLAFACIALIISPEYVVINVQYIVINVQEAVRLVSIHV